MDNIIETIGLSKTYKGGVEALRDLTLEVRYGESLGFLGPNGAGKTTTIQILLNLIRPTKGLVKLFGESMVGRERQLLQNVGALVGMPGYYRSLSPEDILYHVGKVYGMNKHEIRRRTNQVLDLVGLSEAKKRKSGTFSTGMARRLGLAQILVHDPDLIILDEPTNGLDPKGVREVRDLIQEINQEGKTIFMTTHNLTEVDEISNRVVFLNHGRLVGDQSLKELRRQLGAKNIEVKFTRELTGSELDLLRSVENVTEVHTGDEIFLKYSGEGDVTYSILQQIVERGLPINYYRPTTLALEDIYLRIYGERQEASAA